jgi:hypothetical protein
MSNSDPKIMVFQTWWQPGLLDVDDWRNIGGSMLGQE